MSLLAPISDPAFEARLDHAVRRAHRALGLNMVERARFLAWFEGERPDTDDLAAAYAAYRRELLEEALT